MSEHPPNIQQAGTPLLVKHLPRCSLAKGPRDLWSPSLLSSLSLCLSLSLSLGSRLVLTWPGVVDEETFSISRATCFSKSLSPHQTFSHARHLGGLLEEDLGLLIKHVRESPQCVEADGHSECEMGGRVGPDHLDLGHLRCCRREGDRGPLSTQVAGARLEFVETMKWMAKIAGGGCGGWCLSAQRNTGVSLG